MQIKNIVVRFYLDNRRIDDDVPAPLKIVLTRNSERALIPVGISIRKGEWDRKGQEVISPNNTRRHQLNALLQERKTQVWEILHRLASKYVLADLGIFEIKNLVAAELIPAETEEKKPVLFVEHYNRFISRKKGRTHELYKITLSRLREFCATLDTLRFEDIGVAWLHDFETHISPQSPSQNARNIHLRNIRAVFNDAIDEEVTTFYPFRKFKIIGTPTRKRSLPVDKLRSLFNAEVSASDQKYLDFFKLTFMLCGINVVDLCALPPLLEGRAEYCRAKTGRLYSIKVEPEAMALFEKYKGKDQALDVLDSNKDYRSFYKHLASFLREFGSKHGMPGLSTYWARHSWATMAAELDIPDAVISQALGHGPENRITEIYIHRNLKKVDEANRKVLDWVLYSKK